MTEQNTIVFYNVENLFDPFDDPDTNDDEYTQQGSRNWTANKYHKKLFKIASVIKHIDTLYGKPLFIGLCEVENDYVLKGLLDKNSLSEEYNYIHFDSKDERGIDVALLYNKKDFLPLHSEPIFVDISQCDDDKDYTRDILYVNGFYKNELIHLFVVHFPSKRENDINRDKRLVAIKTLRSKIDEIYKHENAPYIVVMGDFNENPTDETLQKLLQTQKNKTLLQPDELYCPSIELYLNKYFTLIHKEQGLLFDQFLLSKRFLQKPSILQFQKKIILNDEKVSEWDRQYKGKPFRTYIGRKYIGGYSDHFPILMQLST